MSSRVSAIDVANGRSVSCVDIQEQFSKARDSYRSSKFKEISSRYDGADISNRLRASEQTRFSKEPSGDATGRSFDSHIASESDYFRVIEIARSLDNDDMIIGQAINRLCNNIMQEGFVYDPKTGSDVADSILKSKWNAWAQSKLECDVQQANSFATGAWLALRSVIVDGDIVVLPLSNGSLQAIEAHRLRTPRGVVDSEGEFTIHGVTVDSNRRRIRYHICRDDIPLNMYPRREDTVAIDALSPEGFPQVMHLYHPRRTTQTRGITQLSRCTDVASMHDDIQFAKLIQQQQVSVWTLVRERQMGFEYPEGAEEYDALEQDPCTPGQTRPIKNISPGMWYTTYPGETVKGFSANVPSPTYFDHAKETQRIIALNLDLPLILMLMDASETNFSGWRGSMEQAKLAFRRFQSWFASVYHAEVLRWKVRQWTTIGSEHFDPVIYSLMKSGADVFSHEWVLPTWPYIEPLKDASADLLELRNALNSPRRIQARRGRDWEVVIDERIEDNLLLMQKAVDAVDDFNRRNEGKLGFSIVPWQTAAMIPTPDGVQISITELQDQQQNQIGKAGDGDDQ